MLHHVVWKKPTNISEELSSFTILFYFVSYSFVCVCISYLWHFVVYHISTVEQYDMPLKFWPVAFSHKVQCGQQILNIGKYVNC
jgi:hypothetical protein